MHIVGNKNYSCPHCNAKLSRKGDDSETDTDNIESVEKFQLLKFRVSSEMISRFIAPSTLNELEAYPPANENQLMFHKGQQYISFVDSRQAAAKATLNQNLEQERLWVYSTIFHELCRRKSEAEKIQIEIDKLRQALRDGDWSEEEEEEISDKIKALRKQVSGGISWLEIADLLRNDRYCEPFCNLFVKRSSDSDELDDEGKIKELVFEKYIHSIMVMYLAPKPKSAAAPETMGLFHSAYPAIEKLKKNENISLPQAVDEFNAAVGDKKNKLSKEDWCNLLQHFMDYSVRANQSFFLRLSDTNPTDIFSAVRFATSKPRRRPVTKPQIERNSGNFTRIVWYLGALLANSTQTSIIHGTIKSNVDLINKVLDALWNTLTTETQLIELSSHWDRDRRQFVQDKANPNAPYRMNLVKLSFRLYENTFLCDVSAGRKNTSTKMLRPIENNFKGFSPFISSEEVIKLDSALHEKWEVFPHFKGTNPISLEQLRAWAQEKRSLLWNNNLWGEQGIFLKHLEDIYMQPELFIQAEHTAQVDKEIARNLQADFKNHSINILACSTTMEMGVDLGNLEVVMLSSVPPQPANYKQRAGRSGRNNRIRSACITLCGSDAIGLRTLYDPIEKIILQPGETVDAKWFTFDEIHTVIHKRKICRVIAHQFLEFEETLRALN